jgi:predicted transcriptional regulator
MNVASRMRKLRELMGWKQSAVASMMNITQQAFSFLNEYTTPLPALCRCAYHRGDSEKIRYAYIF